MGNPNNTGSTSNTNRKQAIAHMLDRQKTAVDSRIEQLVRQHFSFDRAAEPDDAYYETAHAITQQAIQSNAGGKRLRALLSLMWFHACAHANIFASTPAQHGYDAVSEPGDTNQSSHDTKAHTAATTGNDFTDSAFSFLTQPLHSDAILTIASAIEVYQTSALVHDDIIDDADTRRGKPTAHRALKRPGVSGTGLGIMFGDMLATESIAMLSHCIDHPDEDQPQLAMTPILHSILQRFIQMQRDVEIGQVLDLASEHMSLEQPQTLISNALKVYRWKTASYTTIAPLALAGLAAGMHPQTANSWSFRIGAPLGLAFQIADDLIDIIGSPATSGKPLGGDIKEGKRTLLLADTLKSLDESERAFLIDAYAQDERDEPTIARIIELMHTSGAIEHSYSRINVLWQQALGNIKRAASDLQLREEDIDSIITTCSLFVPAQCRTGVQ